MSLLSRAPRRVSLFWVSLCVALMACAPKTSNLPIDLTRAERVSWQNAILGADRALQDKPLSADAPVWRDQMIVGYLRLGMLDSAQSHVELLINTCGEGSMWRGVHASTPLVLERADEIMEINLRRMTLSWDSFLRWMPRKDQRREWAEEQVAMNCRSYDHYFPADPRRDQIEQICDAEQG